MSHSVGEYIMAKDLLSFTNCLSTTQFLSPSQNQHSHGRTTTLADNKFLNRPWKLICATSKQDGQLKHMENRRSANYQPNLWTNEFVQSLGNHHSVETAQENATKLEQKVRHVINKVDMEPLSLLEFIDDVERLGLSYKFEEDINRVLQRIVSTQNLKDQTERSLHETALLFRILRQHGFDISQDVFESFKDEEGKFKVEISKDVQGMLSLYETSNLTFEGENLWEANAFSRTNLMKLMKEGIDVKVAEQVMHVLEGLPYHQRFHRLEARRYMDTYKKMEPHNRFLLELAKLDFNMVQSLHRKELQEVSRWCMDIGLTSKLNFARDRYVESFFWSVGMAPEPQLRNCRIDITKVGKLITVIDDIYDVFGTMDELEMFTNAVERWDVNAINNLPDYMILCFLAVFNTVNAMAYDIFKERGIKCLPYLTKVWSDLCKAYLKEAEWFHNKTIPPFKEFLENALISSAGGVLLTHSYFLVSHKQDITEQALRSLTNYHDVLRSSMTILRLGNDLGTSKDEIERGETSTSIISYMHETGLSEENARQYYKTLIDKEWQKLNKCLVKDSTFPKSFIQLAMNNARITQCIYQYGDGFAQQDISKNIIEALLVEPVPVNML